jgi:hypothetical protein
MQFLVDFEYEKNPSGLNFVPVLIIPLEQPISSAKTKVSQALLKLIRRSKQAEAR